MFRSFPAQKDTYITDRVIKGRRSVNGNVGRAGTLDLFKLHGNTRSGTSDNYELSRLLIKFDMTSVREHVLSNGFDWSDPTFKAHLSMRDVYGGQPTPSEFTVVVLPLSRSFDEGPGKDVAFYSDLSAANFLTASWSGGPVPWFVPGANGKGLLGSDDIDVITSGNLGSGIVSTAASQSFVEGNEDLFVDITTIVSATLAGIIPDCGFRISFSESEENDTRTRFVKRFASRSASAAELRPRLVVGWDDAVRDDRTSMTLDSSGTIHLYNRYGGSLRNLVSGSALTPLTGSNCVLLRLETPVSGGIFSASFVGSQLRRGNRWVDGVYYATIAITTSDPAIREQLDASGSVRFNEYWCSLDGTVGFFTSSFVMRCHDTDVSAPNVPTLSISPIGMNDAYRVSESPIMKFFVRKLDESLTTVRVPRVAKSYSPQIAHFQVRDPDTDTVFIPFDETFGSTKMSSDPSGLTFKLYMDSLVTGRSYVIDILVIDGERRTIYRNVSGRFRVDD